MSTAVTYHKASGAATHSHPGGPTNAAINSACIRAQPTMNAILAAVDDPTEKFLWMSEVLMVCNEPECQKPVTRHRIWFQFNKDYGILVIEVIATEKH